MTRFRGFHLGLLAAIGALMGGDAAPSAPAPAGAQPTPRPRGSRRKQAVRRQAQRNFPAVTGLGSQAVHRARRAENGDAAARSTQIMLGEYEEPTT